jgi:hypothetical protein
MSRFLQLFLCAAFIHIVAAWVAMAQDARPDDSAHVYGVLAAAAGRVVGIDYSRTFPEYCAGIRTMVFDTAEQSGYFEFALTPRSVTRWGLSLDGLRVIGGNDMLPGDSIWTGLYHWVDGDHYAVDGKAEMYNTFQTDFDVYDTNSDATGQSWRVTPEEFSSANTRTQGRLLLYFNRWRREHTIPPDVETYFRSKIALRWPAEQLWFLRTRIRRTDTAWLASVAPAYFERLIPFANIPPQRYSAATSYAIFVNDLLDMLWLRDGVRATKRRDNGDVGAEFAEKIALARANLIGSARDAAITFQIRRAIDSARRIFWTDTVEAQKIREMPVKLLRSFDTICTDRSFFDAASTAVTRWLAVAPGSPAPDFTLQDRTGRSVRLSDLHGAPVYLLIWSTLDPDCSDPLSFASNYASRYDGNVHIVCIGYGGSRETWAKRVATDTTSVLHLHEPHVIEGNIHSAYQLPGTPFGILIDAQGRIMVSDADPDIPGVAEKLKAMAEKSGWH